MIPDQRRQKLLKALRGAGALSVKELCELLGVSHMTVRRDIATLESEGLVQSVTGGVRLLQSIRSEPTYYDKSATNLPAKRAMAGLLADMITNGQTVFLDAGTSLGQLAPHLAETEDLTVVTNDLTTAVQLSDLGNIQIFQVGGHIDPRNRSCVGSFAAEMLSHFNFDLALISTSSWDVKHGVTTPSEFKVGVKRTAMARASRRILVAGSEKFGLVGTFSVADVADFDAIITDSELTDDDAQRLLGAGPDLLRAGD